MKIVRSFIGGKSDFFSVQYESGICNTVATSSDGGTKEASIGFITFKVIISKNYISQFSVPVRHTELNQNCSILQYFCICSCFVFQMKDFDFFSIGKFPENSFCYHVVSSWYVIAVNMFKKRAIYMAHLFFRDPGCRSLPFDA